MSIVDILLATHNGALYLDAQLRSLQSQTFTDWRLIVHDDASTDNTIEIIQKYAAEDARIVLIRDDIRFGNAAKNFMHLTTFANADLIMFCDQDDIWFENKIFNLVEAIKNEEGPCAAYCNAYGYNGDIITLNKTTRFEVSSLQNSLFLNSGIQGCSLILNKKLLQTFHDWPDFICMHDLLVTIAALTFGELKYVDKSLMLYRQHNNNVTGNLVVGKTNRAKKFLRRNSYVLDRDHYNANKSFFNKYRNNIEPAKQVLFMQYFAYADSGLFKRLYIVIKNRFSLGNNIMLMLLKTLIRQPIND